MIKLADKYRIIFKIDNSFAGVSFIEGAGLSGYRDLNFVYIYENDNFEAFLSQEDINKASEIGYQFCVDRKKSQKIHSEMRVSIKNALSFWADLDKTELSKLSNKELKDLYIKYVALTIKLWDYFSLTEFYYFYKVEDVLREAIKSADDLTILLTSPSSSREFLKKAQTLTDKQLRQDQQKIIERLKPSQQIKNLIESVRKWQEVKWGLRVLINRTYLTLDSFDVKFLREISKRYKYTILQLSNMYYQETIDLLNGKKRDKKEIQKRIGLYAAYIENDRINFIFGDDVKDFAKKVRERTIDYYQKFSEFKGRTASPGVVVGKARVFGGENYNFKKTLKTMKKGEILVAESTTPEFMPAIRKAAAIVADQGGITSHAAIISRELKIPCVVGIHYGIRNIKTGDTIEVDANKGTVKKL